MTIRLTRLAPLGGVVVTPDGQPLPKARVQVTNISVFTPSFLFQPKLQPDIFINADDMPEDVTPFWATSDELGQFMFRHLPVGANVELVAHHPDFSPRIYPPPEEWLPLRTGQTNLIIAMMPKTLLTGLVLREGEPVAKARVICRALWGGKELNSLTDETGQFEVALSNSERSFMYSLGGSGRRSMAKQTCISHS
ncbi:MAG: carboxypeptidase-like regulatory domain-containing protein [Candidatus Fervidibacter sp.]|uniref:carboxypeptidase-like regulatory domain-containing protein n=1 Tax=Candidatus Fervidibacter sp. TaxID=3100871 RepID=UPI00404AEC28